MDCQVRQAFLMKPQGCGKRKYKLHVGEEVGLSVGAREDLFDILESIASGACLLGPFLESVTIKNGDLKKKMKHVYNQSY